MFCPPKLGVGAVYTPALGPYLERRPEAFDVLEVEPQTMWLAQHPVDGPFSLFDSAFRAFIEHGRPGLVHSVGMPLGGTRKPSTAQLALVRVMAETLQSPWVSEHLSVAGTPHQSAGFLLPPLQTEAGVAAAVSNIRRFSEGVGRPVAVETGVSYLARKPFEMPDGEFLGRVVEEANCGILLDLHNLYCNEKNGRESVRDVLDKLPLERVWEVHLAGGMEVDGYWLDAHSGSMPTELRNLAHDVIVQLPNLGALNFEIYGTFLERMHDDEIDMIVRSLRDLWAAAGREAEPDAEKALPISSLLSDGYCSSDGPSPEHWELGLTQALWKSDAASHAFVEDADALRLYTKLASSFRGSMLSRVVPRAIRYLILRELDNGVEALLNTYYSSVPAQMFGPLEATAFRDWAISKIPTDTILLALLDYDVAMIETELDLRPRLVHFPVDPRSIFEALSESRLPIVTMDAVPWEIELLPDTLPEPSSDARETTPKQRQSLNNLGSHERGGI